MQPKRWQDWANGFLGLWMLASIWFFGFSMDGSTAARTALILGAAIIVFAGLAVYLPRAWEEAINIVLGICLLASPWALSYTDQARATTNAATVGLLVIAFGIWAMLEDTRLRKWWRERHL
jgi:SPW repeat